MERTRIDRWLWAARFCKTRSLATAAVAGGRVRVNGERVKPAKEVTAGDEVEVRVGETVWTVVIRGVAEKRGSASVAATLYAETEESVAERERRAAERRAQFASGTGPGGRRPTKLDRRRVDALRRRGG
jgi:ribosome-associated heat shock protein Hsp15